MPIPSEHAEYPWVGFSGGAREPVPQALKRFMQDLLGFADRVIHAFYRFLFSFLGELPVGRVVLSHPK